MAFGSRHCWGLALLLLFITQVMVSAAYQGHDDRSNTHGYDHQDRNSRRPDRVEQDSHGGHSSERDSSKESRDDRYDQEREKKGSSNTATTAMLQTSMLVGTSLVLYWI